MLLNEEVKFPAVFKKYKRKIRKNSAYIILTLLFIVIIFIILSERKVKPEYPQTPLPNLDKNFSKWSIPDDMKLALWRAKQKSPINPKTGRHSLAVFLANEGMINFTLNSLCSLKFVETQPNQHITIALDRETYDAISNINETVIMYKSNFTKRLVNNNQLVNFYDIIKIKPTVIHQFLMWDTEIINFDGDTVFLKNPYDVFKDESDYEVQCDSKEYYQVPYNVTPVPWQVNLGVHKVHPSPSMLKLYPMYLRKLYMTPKKHDQSVLRQVLKPYKKKWLNNDTFIINTTKYLGADNPNLTMRFLDPMLVTNAGGLYLDGKKNWKKESKRRNIDMPVLIHFFHLGHNRDKKNLMKKQQLWFVNDNLECEKEKPPGAVNFKVWK